MKGFVRDTGRFFVRTFVPKIGYPVLKGPLKGKRFVLGSFAGEGGGASVYLNQSEPEQTAAFVAEVKEGDTVFDIGANVGYYSILASGLVGKTGVVAAFEPSPRNLRFLQEHVDLNKTENVKIMPFACSATSGIATFHNGPNPAMGSLDQVGGEEITVVTETIDEVAEKTGLRPDVMKIDVEGGEADVLKGAVRTIESNRPAIFLSTHSLDLRTSCHEWLNERGYSLISLIDQEDSHEFLAKHPERH